MRRAVRHRQPSGAVALLTIVTISAFTLAIITAVSVIATSLVSSATTHRITEQVFYAAESGLHEALYRLGQNPGAQTFPLEINSVSVVVTIAIDPADVHGKDRIITSVANGQNIQRSLEIRASTGALGNAITYAVQAGDGGIDMASNSTEIWGDLFANGPITGSGNIFGDASSSGGSGSISGVTIGKASAPTPGSNCPNPAATDPEYNSHKLKSHSLYDVKVFGQAYFQALPAPPGPPRFVKAGAAGNVTCTVAGDGLNCFGAQADPAPTSYPITPQQITDLKDLADNTTVTGDVTITADTTLSARKIVGNLTVTGGVLTLDGPVWVTGTVDVNHPGVTVRLPASAGEASGALITDQSIDIKNNATLQGSGNSKSFLIVMALKADTVNFVIRGANNSTAVIYFAPDGLITVSQNAGLNNTTGKKIHLENGSCIQYDPNLTGFFIPSGPPQPPLPHPLSWREI